MAKPDTPASRLPSLDLLKGFDAAARHLSFTRAAEDLFLTQSALSRQIQTLEEQLGVALFERRHRELRLTDAGQILHISAKNMLDELSHAVARIRREQSSQPLTVSTNQPFASLWLIPRLSQFRERYPDVDVFISADNRVVDLERERIDLAVRYCTEAMAPPGSPRLFGERLVPVCSPSLAADPERPLKRPEDLARHVLLHIDDRARAISVAQLVGVAVGNRHTRFEARGVDTLQSFRSGSASGAGRPGRRAGTRALDRQPSARAPPRRAFPGQVHDQPRLLCHQHEPGVDAACGAGVHRMAP